MGHRWKMSDHKVLSPGEREFFSLLKAAILANPFSDERVRIDLRITGLSPHVSDTDRVAKLTREVHTRMRAVEEEGNINIRQLSGEDRKLLEYAFLFDFFHQYLDKFDELIPFQIQAGDTSLSVPFFSEAFAVLRQRGFAKKDALRYFALCYQLRRAFFFIHHSLVGRSSCMKELRRNLWNNMFTHDIGLYDEYLWNRMEDFSTLIIGETGTGKGASALAVGRSGFIPFDEKKKCFAESFTRSFVSLNLSQFPETLIESELFGHKKGAFTGATEDHKGVFDRCSPFGSIFLDEIGEVSIPIQIKLLQVLQERVFTAVGSHRKHRFQGRIIAATNRSLHEIREEYILREDFFYRLCSDIIIVPPLRQRIQEDPGELDDLLAHTLERILGQPSPKLVEMVQDIISKQLGRSYAWPGNVRELEQCVRRILLKREYEGDERVVGSGPEARIRRALKNGDMNARELLSAYCCLLYQRHGTYEAVSRQVELDRRTVKKYIESSLLSVS